MLGIIGDNFASRQQPFILPWPTCGTVVLPAGSYSYPTSDPCNINGYEQIVQLWDTNELIRLLISDSVTIP